MTRVEQLDPEACYRASIGREARWDGRFYLGVVTTGVYCRPSCPARKPLQRNCRFYATAAAAVAAGFRACKRCQPGSLPGSRHWDARGDLAARAVRMIRDGVVDEVGVSGLATRLAVSERHLLRVLLAEVGASPQQLARTRRAQTARMLAEQTDLPLVAGEDVKRRPLGQRPPGPARRARLGHPLQHPPQALLLRPSQPQHLRERQQGRYPTTHGLTINRVSTIRGEGPCSPRRSVPTTSPRPP